MKLIYNRVLQYYIISLLIMSCSDDETIPVVMEPQLPTISEWVLSQNEDYDSLKLALEKSKLFSDLDKKGNFTLFAQKNDAYLPGLAFFYSDLPQGYISDIPEVMIRTAMQNNIFDERVILSTDTEGMYYSKISRTAPNNRAEMYYFNLKYSDFTNSLLINKSISISDINIQASNGVIHIIDRVLPSNSLMDFMLQNDSLSMLSLASNQFYDISNIINNTSGSSNLVKTFFAPSNKAFRALIAADTSINTVYDIDTARLRKILNHHIVERANITKAQLTNGLLRTRNNDDLSIKVNSDLTINSSASVSAKITTENIQGRNGIMHIIDNVLLPN